MAGTRIDYYQVLGVPRDATRDQLRVAYRAGIAQWHPDRSESKHAHAVTALLNDAWQTLGNEETRRQYDVETAAQNEAAPPTAPVSTPDKEQIHRVWSLKVFGGVLIVLGVGAAIREVAKQPRQDPETLALALMWLAILVGVPAWRFKGTWAEASRVAARQVARLLRLVTVFALIGAVSAALWFLVPFSLGGPLPSIGVALALLIALLAAGVPWIENGPLVPAWLRPPTWVRRAATWAAVATAAVALALVIGPSWSLVLIAATGLLVLMRSKRA